MSSGERAYRPLLPGISHLKFGDEEVLDHIDAQVAAVIIEPVQGEAGVRIPSAKYLQKVSRRCREVGALLIFDEAQTGWGRTGTFWALEGFGNRCQMCWLRQKRSAAGSLWALLLPLQR